MREQAKYTINVAANELVGTLSVKRVPRAASARRGRC